MTKLISLTSALLVMIPLSIIALNQAAQIVG